MKNVMPAMKYQLPAMFIFQSGASSCAAGSVRPSNSASSWPGSRFAENPPATPANDAAMPTIGCRPAAAYKAPASGIMTTKAASAAWFAMTDTKMTIGVSQTRRGAADGGSHRRAGESGALGQARAEHDQQHVAEGCESRQRARHLDEQTLEIAAREQAGRANVLLGDRVDRLPARSGAHGAEYDHRGNQPDEDQHRVRQAVARALDRVEHALPARDAALHGHLDCHRWARQRLEPRGGPASQASAMRTQALPPSGIRSSLKS